MIPKFDHDAEVSFLQFRNFLEIVWKKPHWKSSFSEICQVIEGNIGWSPKETSDQRKRSKTKMRALCGFHLDDTAYG